MQDSLVKILEIDRKLEACICHRSLEQDLIHFFYSFFQTAHSVIVIQVVL